MSELRTVADLARVLNISRQRLHRYVSDSRAQPVRREGRRLLYDATGQALIVNEYFWAQTLDTDSRRWMTGEYADLERDRWARLCELGEELGCADFWRERAHSHWKPPAPARS